MFGISDINGIQEVKIFLDSSTLNRFAKRSVQSFSHCTYCVKFIDSTVFFNSFYRATLCVSAVFAVARCPSVRPSVALVHYAPPIRPRLMALYKCVLIDWLIVSRRLKISSNFFVGPVAQSFCHSSFLTPSTGTQFQGDPFSGGAKYKGWENFAIFD